MNEEVAPSADWIEVDPLWNNLGRDDRRAIIGMLRDMDAGGYF